MSDSEDNYADDWDDDFEDERGKDAQMTKNGGGGGSSANEKSELEYSQNFSEVGELDESLADMDQESFGGSEKGKGDAPARLESEEHDRAPLPEQRQRANTDTPNARTPSSSPSSAQQQRIDDALIAAREDAERKKQRGGPLTVSSSTAVAALMRRQITRNKGFPDGGDRSTAAVLDWLASAASVSPNSQQYVDDSWWKNPELQYTSTEEVATSKRYPSYIGHALPGSVEEAVLELALESVLKMPLAPTAEEDALEEIAADDGYGLGHDIPRRRRRRHKHVDLPKDDERVQLLESIVEEQYLDLVKRACAVSDNPGGSGAAGDSKAARAIHCDVQQALVEVFADVVTDASIVATIKSAVMSRLTSPSDPDDVSRP
tara:strand:- start:1557 stop:2681 length:1125 start_codon:yes stop_codon:yes gene_type:complete